jgi:hypothetical protein
VSTQTNSKRYLFQADATGVAGQFIYPFNDVIPIQAASTLPSIGGFGSSRVDGFRHKDILSFDSAYTEVVGTETEDGVFETVALSVVENFKLLDFVTCDRIVGRLTGRRPGSLEVPAQHFIVPAGSVFEGLRIGDRFFEKLDLAPDFFCTPEHATWTGLLEALENERDRRLLESLSLPAPNGDPVPLPIPGRRTDLLGFCIALGEPTVDAVLGAPLIFTVPEFGTVHLGEFFCEPTSRRLIMLRVELDGAVQGQVVAGDPIVDGGPYPP